MLPQISKPKKPIYLDHAATTPLDPLVEKAMRPFWHEKFGNPSSLYQKGREAKTAIDEARANIAKLINARPKEIIFTAGGSESVNLAIFGVARAKRMDADKKKDGRGRPHLIASAVEHHCVLKSLEALAGEGYKTSFIGVDNFGSINIDKLKRAVGPQTILISVMLANNEVGTIQPVVEIGKWLKQINTDRQKNGLTRILFHTDACQAAGSLNLDVNHLGIDLMSVNGSKIYGPKQTGFLYVRSGINLKPLIYGGGQETDLRSGTENVPAIVGLAKAFELAQANRESENQRIGKLQSYLIKEIKSKIKGALLNGPDSQTLKSGNKNSFRQKNYHPALVRLPNNINFSFSGVEGEALMLYLDGYGIAVSTSSACSTGSADPSHVLLAMGRTEDQAKSSIRFSLGKTTSKKDLDYLLKILPNLVTEIRKM